VFQIRPAVHADYATFARLFLELKTPEDVPSESLWQSFICERAWVATESDAVVGYIYFQVLPKSLYIRHLVSAPEVRRRGLGRFLLESVRAKYRGQAQQTWELNVKQDNEAAIAFYRSLGMQPKYETRVLRMPLTEASRVAYHKEAERANPPLAVAKFEREEDAAFEQALGLPTGLLGDSRALPTRVMLGATQAGKPVGVAAFDPAFPGAFPFRAHKETGTAAVAALLAAMFTHRRENLDWVQLVVEDNVQAASYMLEQGGTVVLELFHYEGKL
jgi:ribosomal protein S18 acetylase RimI-like enzyme